jgi:hypothetical protein
MKLQTKLLSVAFYFTCSASIFSRKNYNQRKNQTSSNKCTFGNAKYVPNCIWSARSEYYQQKADYKMEVELDDKTPSYTVMKPLLIPIMKL